MWCEVLEFERTKEKILVERQKAVRFKGAMLFTPSIIFVVIATVMKRELCRSGTV